VSHRNATWLYFGLNDLQQRLRNHEAGDVVTLGIKRGEEIARVRVKLRAI